MTGLFDNAVAIAHHLASTLLQPGEIAVDATAGNGNDTVFLAALVGACGKVYAFDIQAEALQRTQEKLRESRLASQVQLIHDGHQHLKKYIKEPVAVVLFNLGYLPGGCKQLVTKPTTTLQALEQAVCLLKISGIVCLTVYTGHPGGYEEWETVANYLKTLPQEHYSIVLHRFVNRSPNYPFTVSIQKLK